MTSLAHRAIKKILRLIPAWTYPLYCRVQGIRTKNLGIPRGIVCLSFDNDYTADNEAAGNLLPLFQSYRIPVTWAVIGLWVKKYLYLHQQLLDSGHELMNHSWSHPDNQELRPGDPRKFHQVTAEEIEEEITHAHEFCLNKLGYRMQGFRLPHFRNHPAVESVLLRLGYRYTSNLGALSSCTLGVPYRTDRGLIELPLSPIPRRPDCIVETYRLFRAPNGLYSSEREFLDDFTRILKYTERYRLMTFMYFDACDIVRLSIPSFEHYLQRLKEANVEVCTFGQVAEIVSRQM